MTMTEPRSDALLKWDLFVTSGIPTVTPDPPSGERRRFFSPISSTLIYGKRDALLVDTFMTVDQNDVLADWIKGSGKNLTTIYVTHGHGDHWFGIGALLERFPGARAVASPGVVNMMKRRRASGRIGEGEDLRAAGAGGQRSAGVEVRHEDDGLQRRQLLDQVAHGLTPIVGLAAVAIAVHREEHFCIDLSEAIDDPHGPHVRRAARPDGAQARRREERRDRLRDVGQVRDHAVAGPDAKALERGRERADLRCQRGPRDLRARPRLGLEDDGGSVSRR